MAGEAHRPGGEERTEAAVGYGGEPHGSEDTRDATRRERAGPDPEDLDAREEQLTGPRKPMGPTEEPDVPETVPDE
jgi:hypothetical protein